MITFILLLAIGQTPAPVSGMMGAGQIPEIPRGYHLEASQPYWGPTGDINWGMWAIVKDRPRGVSTWRGRPLQPAYKPRLDWGD